MFKKQISSLLIAGSLMPILANSSVSAMEEQVSENSTFYTAEKVDNVSSTNEEKTETEKQNVSSTDEEKTETEKQSDNPEEQEFGITQNSTENKGNNTIDQKSTNNDVTKTGNYAIHALEIGCGAGLMKAGEEIYHKTVSKKTDAVTLPKNLDEPPKSEEQTSDEKVPLSKWYEWQTWRNYKNGYRISFWINCTVSGLGIINGLIILLFTKRKKKELNPLGGIIMQLLLFFCSTGNPYLGTAFNSILNIAMVYVEHSEHSPSEIWKNLTSLFKKTKHEEVSFIPYQG